MQLSVIMTPNPNPESSLNKDKTFIHNASSILVFLNFIWPKKPLTLKKHLWNPEQNSRTLMEKARPQTRREKIHVQQGHKPNILFKYTYCTYTQDNSA
jgi:hypothetical protein